MSLPGYHEWMGSPEWKAHLFDHEKATTGCVACDQRPLMHAIHDAIFSSGADGKKAAAVAWSLQDGYGKVGFTPAQGWDWSGIRDSSPAAVHSIGVGLGLVEVSV